MTDPWRDDLTTQVGMDNCISCQKATRSHLLLLQWDDDRDIFRVVTDPQVADAYGHVCHACYQREDGNPTPIVNEYTSRVIRLCSAYDTDPSTLVETPQLVQDKMDDDDWNKL